MNTSMIESLSVEVSDNEGGVIPFPQVEKKRAYDLAQFMSESIVAKCHVEVDDLNQRTNEEFSKKVTKYFTMEVFYGRHPLKQKKTYAVKLTSSLGDKESICIFMDDLVSDRKDVSRKIEEDLNSIGYLLPNDMKRIKECALYIKKNNLASSVDSLISFVDDAVGDIEARENYYKLLKFVASHRYMFASRKKNDFNADEHVGCILDDKANIKKYGEVILAMESSAVASLIYGCREITDISTGISFNTQDFNGIKQGLRDIGALIWYGKDGRKKTTVGTNTTKQCLIIRLNNQIE